MADEFLKIEISRLEGCVRDQKVLRDLARTESARLRLALSGCYHLAAAGMTVRVIETAGAALLGTKQAKDNS